MQEGGPEHGPTAGASSWPFRSLPVLGFQLCLQLLWGRGLVGWEGGPWPHHRGPPAPLPPPVTGCLPLEHLRPAACRGKGSRQGLWVTWCPVPRFLHLGNGWRVITLKLCGSPHPGSSSALTSRSLSPVCTSVFFLSPRLWGQGAHPLGLLSGCPAHSECLVDAGSVHHGQHQALQG